MKLQVYRSQASNLLRLPAFVSVDLLWTIDHLELLVLRLGVASFSHDPLRAYSYFSAAQALHQSSLSRVRAVQTHFLFVLGLVPASPQCTSLRRSHRHDVLLRHPTTRVDSRLQGP
jgi:hypothetical protein